MYQLFIPHCVMDPFLEHFTHTPITKPPIPRAEPPDLDTHKDWGQPKLISAHLGSPNCKPISPSVHSLRPVALPNCRLYAAAAGPRAGPEGAPGAPGSVCHWRLSLLGHTHPKPAVLQVKERHGKGGIVLLCNMSHQPGQQDSASLISQPHTMILQSNKTELLYISSLTPMFFFLCTLKWQSEGKVLRLWNDL